MFKLRNILAQKLSYVQDFSSSNVWEQASCAKTWEDSPRMDEESYKIYLKMKKFEEKAEADLFKREMVSSFYLEFVPNEWWKKYYWAVPKHLRSVENGLRTVPKIYMERFLNIATKKAEYLGYIREASYELKKTKKEMEYLNRLLPRYKNVYALKKRYNAVRYKMVLIRNSLSLMWKVVKHCDNVLEKIYEEKERYLSCIELLKEDPYLPKGLPVGRTNGKKQKRYAEIGEYEDNQGFAVHYLHEL